MDLIDRQAALDAMRHIGEVYVNNLPTMIDKASAQTELMMLPSAQPEIVYCKDCKHGSPNGVYGCRIGRFSLNDGSERMYAKDWCSRAERREDGTA